MGKKNLHEAFQEAAERQRAALQREAELRAAAEAAAPEPQPEPALPGRSPGSAAVPRGASVLDAPEERRWADAFRDPVVLAALVAAFALGTLFGSSPAEAVRATPEVGALRGPGNGEAQEPSADAPLLSAEAADAGPTQADVARALADPENRYTIQVATYDQDPSGLEWARDLVSWLEEHELPVAPPQEVGDDYVVLVGVGRTQAELEALQEYVRAMPNAAQSEGEFADAYIINIDRLVER